MGQFLLLVVVALTVGAVVFGVTVLLTGGDGGLSPAEPDGRAVPLPGTRPLTESDIAQVRFDVATRGYRMAQVDQAMRRAAYDIGYKDELINVLEAEVDALRAGRFSDAEVLRRAREAAQRPAGTAPEGTASGDASAPARAEGDHETAAIDAGKAAKEPEQAWAERPSSAAATGRPSPVATAAEPSAATEQPTAAAEEPSAAAEQPAAGGAAGPLERSEPAEPAAGKADETATRADAGPGNDPHASGAEIDLEAGAEPSTAADPGPETDAGTATDRPEPDSILPSRR